MAALQYSTLDDLVVTGDTVTTSSLITGFTLAHIRSALLGHRARFGPTYYIEAGVNDKLPFVYSSTSYTATIAPGLYGDDLPSVVEAAIVALENTNNWDVEFNLTTREFTIAGDNNFDLDWTRPATLGQTIGPDLGFDVGSDDTGADSYTSDNSYQNVEGHWVKVDLGAGVNKTVKAIGLEGVRTSQTATSRPSDIPGNLMNVAYYTSANDHGDKRSDWEAAVTAGQATRHFIINIAPTGSTSDPYRNFAHRNEVHLISSDTGVASARWHYLNIYEPGPVLIENGYPMMELGKVSILSETKLGNDASEPDLRPSTGRRFGHVMEGRGRVAVAGNRHQLVQPFRTELGPLSYGGLSDDELADFDLSFNRHGIDIPFWFVPEAVDRPAGSWVHVGSAAGGYTKSDRAFYCYFRNGIVRDEEVRRSQTVSRSRIDLDLEIAVSGAPRRIV